MYEVIFTFDNDVKLAYMWPMEDIRRLRQEYQLGRQTKTWIHSSGVICLDKVLYIKWPRNADIAVPGEE